MYNKWNGILGVLMIIVNMFVAFLFMGSLMFFLYPIIGQVLLILDMLMLFMGFVNHKGWRLSVFWITLVMWIIFAAFVPASLILMH